MFNIHTKKSTDVIQLEAMALFYLFYNWQSSPVNCFSPKHDFHHKIANSAINNTHKHHIYNSLHLLAVLADIIARSAIWHTGIWLVPLIRDIWSRLTSSFQFVVNFLHSFCSPLAQFAWNLQTANPSAANYRFSFFGKSGTETPETPNKALNVGISIR